MNMKRTLIATIFSLMSTVAMAETITVQGSGTSPFSGYSVGTTPTTGFQNSTTISNPGFDNISSITFSGAGTGVYAGSVLDVASSPYTLGTFATAICSSCSEYFSVEPGGSITITFNTPQTSLDVIWGTVDVAPGYNLVTTNNGQTIDGATINSLLGNPSSGSVNSAIEAVGLEAFTSVTFQDTTNNVPAFEFDIGATPPITQSPLPGTLPLFATGLVALGLWQHRRKKIGSRSIIS